MSADAPVCEPSSAGQGCSQGMKSSVSEPGCSLLHHLHLHPSSVTDTQITAQNLTFVNASSSTERFIHN